MRELKFRAPIIENGECHFLYFEMETLVRKRLYFSQREILLPWLRAGGKPDEYIGLEDKSGQEIYSGDILRVDDDKRYLKCRPKPKVGEHIGVFQVKIDLGNWGYETTWEHISGYECSTHIMGHTLDDGRMPNVEVIGNIYENPELLEAVR